MKNFFQEQHPGFQRKQQELEEFKEQRMQSVLNWKKFQLQNLQLMFEIEKQQLEVEFEVCIPHISILSLVIRCLGRQERFTH